jgi:hypothetical protein
MILLAFKLSAVANDRRGCGCKDENWASCIDCR